MCTQHLPVLDWMNNLLTQKFTLQKSTMSLLFKNYLFVEVIYLLLIKFNNTKSFMWNTKNTDRNGINEQNTHTPPREKDTFRKG